MKSIFDKSFRLICRWSLSNLHENLRNFTVNWNDLFVEFWNIVLKLRTLNIWYSKTPYILRFKIWRCWQFGRSLFSDFMLEYISSLYMLDSLCPYIVQLTFLRTRTSLFLGNLGISDATQYVSNMYLLFSCTFI